MINKLWCWLVKHKRIQKLSCKKLPIGYRWTVKCERCGYKVSYDSPMARLVGKEMFLGFDGC